MTELHADVAVVGGGIVGLAHAYTAAKTGKSVVLFERQGQAHGASIRNFGMIWPIGQPSGEMLETALASRSIWREVLERCRMPYFETGSLHLAYHDDEADVCREFAELGAAEGYETEWWNPGQVLAKSPAAQPAGLRGALWSATEMTVDPRMVVQTLPQFLEERFDVTLRYGEAVRSIALPHVETAREIWHVGRAIVCSGDDFETLYPDLLQSSGITRCKLQMLRTGAQPEGWMLGPALAAGLTLRFYSSFRICGSLAALQARYQEEMAEYEKWGIHVMAAQTPRGEVTLGDSHEYGHDVDIFNKERIDELILRYLETFLVLPRPAIEERWHGVYAKHFDKPYFTAEPEPGVRVVTALGGAGMTLSFGLAERMWKQMEE